MRHHRHIWIRISAIILIFVTTLYTNYKNIDHHDTSTFSVVKDDIDRAALGNTLPFPDDIPSNGIPSNKNTSNKKFSACLLTMDDNHRLVEWLAYHHYVLPLQHLVIAVDPRSTTSPTALLDRWRARGMIIEQWSDEDFLSRKKAKRFRKDQTEKIRLQMHRERQATFLSSCMQHLKKQNSTWTLLIDTDEYLQFNGPIGVSNLNVTSLAYRSVQEQGAMWKFLVELDQRNEAKSCIQVPRLTFGNIATIDDTKVLPPKFNDLLLDTIRYRKHGDRDGFKYNRYSKPLINLSKISFEDIPRRGQGVHRPIKLCGVATVPDDNTIFRINHYVGSWEVFNSRKNDSRSKKLVNQRFRDRSSLDSDSDDNIRPWIDGFIDYHGESESLALLEGAGVF